MKRGLSGFVLGQHQAVNAMLVVRDYNDGYNKAIRGMYEHHHFCSLLVTERFATVGDLTHIPREFGVLQENSFRDSIEIESRKTSRIHCSDVGCACIRSTNTFHFSASINLCCSIKHKYGGTATIILDLNSRRKTNRQYEDIGTDGPALCDDA